MENVIELIENRMIELENQMKNENLDTDYQRQVNSNYYRGALNELYRLKEKLKTQN